MSWELPTDAEAWALASLTCAWVDPRLSKEASALERRCEALRCELEDTEAVRARLRAEERARSQAEWGALREEVLAARAVQVSAAAEAALAVASAVVGEQLERSPAHLQSLLERALDARDGGPAPRRVKVACGCGEAVGAWLVAAGREAPVHEDPTLAFGDVVVEYPDGRQDMRLATLLAAALPTLEEELR